MNYTHTCIKNATYDALIILMSDCECLVHRMNS